MIRFAVLPDVPRLVEMGRRFRRESNYGSMIGENPEQMARTAAQLIESAGGVLVSERGGELVGMLGFVVFPHFLSGEIVAGEVMWWVEPEHRGDGLKLLRAAESAARARGAVKMHMIAPTEQVGAIYRRLGYELVESTFQRCLC